MGLKGTLSCIHWVIVYWYGSGYKQIQILSKWCRNSEVQNVYFPQKETTKPNTQILQQSCHSSGREKLGGTELWPHALVGQGQLFCGTCTSLTSATRRKKEFNPPQIRPYTAAHHRLLPLSVSSATRLPGSPEPIPANLILIVYLTNVPTSPCLKSRGIFYSSPVGPGT